MGSTLKRQSRGSTTRQNPLNVNELEAHRIVVDDALLHTSSVHRHRPLVSPGCLSPFIFRHSVWEMNRRGGGGWLWLRRRRTRWITGRSRSESVPDYNRVTFIHIGPFETAPSGQIGLQELLTPVVHPPIQPSVLLNTVLCLSCSTRVNGKKMRRQVSTLKMQLD